MTQASEPETSQQKPTEAEIEAKLAGLEKFIARRFDEISMEIEATSQLMEMAEQDAGRRFAEMVGVLNSISSIGDGTSPANSGKELEAVVIETEKAATKIMDSADKIKSTLDKYEDDFASDMHLATLSEIIYTEINHILLACEFQDLISQRVRTALKNLREIQESMDNILSKFGIDTKAIQSSQPVQTETPSATPATASQSDIDALFD